MKQNTLKMRCFFSGMPITVSSFYKTRITNTGVAKGKEIYTVQTPSDNSSCSNSFEVEIMSLTIVSMTILSNQLKLKLRKN